MKKVFFNLFLGTLIFGGIIFISSCKKCATCTYEDAAGTTQDTSDYCDKGNAYKDWLEQHEKNGWKCTEE